MTLSYPRPPMPFIVFPPPPDDDADGTSGDRPPQVDYDLHPLEVGCLEHYIAPDDKDKRFRVT